MTGRDKQDKERAAIRHARDVLHELRRSLAALECRDRLTELDALVALAEIEAERYLTTISVDRQR